MPELQKTLAKDKIFIKIGPKNREENFRKNIRKLYLYQFFMNFMLISGILIPFFMGWGKLNFVEIMYLEAFFTLMIFIFEIPCGAISDYISRKFSLMLAGITGILGVLIYTSYPHILIFAFGEALFALTMALISGTDQAITYDTLRKLGNEQQLSKIIARANIYALIGMMISAPLGSFLALFIPLPSVFLLMIIPLLGGMITALRLKEPNHAIEKKSQSYLEILKSGFKELKRNKALRYLSLDSLIIELFTFFMIWTYQLYLEDLYVPIVFYGVVAAGLTSIQMIFSHYIPKWEEVFSNRKKLLFIYSILPGISYLLIAWITFLPISLSFIILIVGLGFSRKLLFVKPINELIESSNRSTVLSTVSMIGNLIRAGISPLMGYIIMWDLKIAFIVLGILVITFALLSRLKNKYL